MLVNRPVDGLYTEHIPGYTMTATDTEIREVEKMFAVNVFGPMRMVRYFHRMLIAAQGIIVNIGSIGGVIPYIYGGTYNQVDRVMFRDIY